MASFLWILLLPGFYPLARAWWANRRTSLLHSLNWAITAWVIWMMSLAAAAGAEGEGGFAASRYLALCLTGCAGVTVLGARRPHVGAWNLVVVGLLAVMLLPLVENWLVNVPLRDPLRVVFLAGTLGVAILNYLPTRLGAAALLLALGCAGEMMLLFAVESLPASVPTALLSRLCLAATPWVAFVLVLGQAPADNEIDRLWLEFRNRYGLFWGQRLREQFNRAALNSGWPVYLSWQGMRRLVVSGPEPARPEEILNTLRALQQRFLGDDGERGDEAP